MILDHYQSEVSYIKQELLDLENLYLKNEYFLSGLGLHADKSKQLLTNIPIVQNIVWADELMCSQQYCELPEPRPYQYFIGEIEDEIGRLRYKNEFYCEDNPVIFETSSMSMDNLSQEIEVAIDKAVKQHNVISCLRNRPELNGLSVEQITAHIESGILPRIHDYIFSLFTAIKCGGIRYSIFYSHMYKILMSGGLPCGWVGVPYAEGGDPNYCMQVLHFGERV